MRHDLEFRKSKAVLEKQGRIRVPRAGHPLKHCLTGINKIVSLRKNRVGKERRESRTRLDYQKSKEPGSTKGEEEIPQEKPKGTQLKKESKLNVRGKKFGTPTTREGARKEGVKVKKVLHKSWRRQRQEKRSNN